MALHTRPMSVEEFDQWVEDTNELYEYIGGAVVTSPSNAFVSKIAARFIRYLGAFVDDRATSPPNRAATWSLASAMPPTRPISPSNASPNWRIKATIPICR